MNRVYLVRHGENWANLTKEFSYRKVDYSLTDKGRLQAQQTAEYFVDKDIQEIYTSPLKRAVETADLIAGRINLPITILEELREVNVGDLEGQPVTAEAWSLHHRILNDWWNGQGETTFPGGESFFELLKRWKFALAHMLDGKDGRNLLVVAHGGIFTLTLHALVPGIEAAWVRTIDNGNCSISELAARVVDGQVEAHLVSWASCAHLHGEAAHLISGVPSREGLQQGVVR